MALSLYHQNYAQQSDAEIENKVNEKREELAVVFKQVQLKTSSEIVRVAVIGCGDRRLVKKHKVIFESFTKKPVEMITFDVSTKHLGGEKNVIQHDCALPLPNGPFDLTYSHVLLRFIDTEKQWDVLKNSYDALKPGGLAIHLLDREDYETIKSKHANGLFAVPLDKWKAKFDELGVRYKEVPVKYGLALAILKNNFA